MIFTAATIQYKPLKDRPGENLSALLSLCRIASQRGAELIVLPEMCLSGYIFRNKDEAEKIAEPVEGKSFTAFAEFCLANSCYISYGYAEKSGNRLYNAQNLIGPDGKLIMRYRKMHLFEADIAWASPGDLGFMSADTPLGIMGTGICMDINYDDFVLYHIESGTRLLLFPTNWIDQGFDVLPYWSSRLKGFKGTVFIANKYGCEEGIFFSGKSSVYHNGSFISSASSQGNAVLFTVHETD